MGLLLAFITGNRHRDYGEDTSRRESRSCPILVKL